MMMDGVNNSGGSQLFIVWHLAENEVVTLLIDPL